MALVVTLHRAAGAELAEAGAWYESKRAGLGREFIAEIERCITSAAENPLQYALIHNDTHRIVARRFPYSIYFRAEPQRIVVMAIFHSRRDPLIWQTR